MTFCIKITFSSGPNWAKPPHIRSTKLHKQIPKSSQSVHVSLQKENMKRKRLSKEARPSGPFKINDTRPCTRINSQNHHLRRQMNKATVWNTCGTTQGNTSSRHWLRMSPFYHRIWTAKQGYSCLPFPSAPVMRKSGCSPHLSDTFCQPTPMVMSHSWQARRPVSVRGLMRAWFELCSTIPRGK